MEAPGVVRELRMRCRPVSPSLGTHTPSPPSNLVEIPPLPLSLLS